MGIIGIDAGATWVKAGRLTEDLKLENSLTRPSGAGHGRVAYFDSIAAAAEQLGVTATDRVGVAVPGLLDRDGQSLKYAANVLDLAEVAGRSLPLAPEWSARLPTARIVVDNDAKCAGLAEWQLGGGAESNVSLLHVTWGTGIGTAFVTEGRAQYGWEGGHVPLSWGRKAPLRCGCGSWRDMEAFCAVPHLEQQSGLTAEALLAAAEGGKVKPRQIIEEAVKWFARGLHTMSVLVYPERVTIGGGFMASDWLLELLREKVAAEATGYLSDTLRPEIVHRAVLGNEAGMIGAALLAKAKFG